MNCPNCESTMEPGGQCPSCEHDDSDDDCECDWCYENGEEYGDAAADDFVDDASDPDNAEI